MSICLYNSSPYVDETIESLLAQTWTDFEAILVDDGSTDGCLERIAARFPDPRLRLVRQPHRGLGAARLRSVSHARGRYVAFLDHDDVWAPTKLERQMAAATAHPNAGLIFCDCTLVDGTGHVVGAMSDRYDYSQIDFSAGIVHDELLARGCFIPLSTAMAGGDAVKQAGGARSTYDFINDYDLWLRIARTHSIVFVDERLASWRIHETQFSQRRPDTSAAELRSLWHPIVHNPTYPAALRKIVDDNLFGQLRCAVLTLARQHRWRAAASMAASAVREPGALIRYCVGFAGSSPIRRLKGAFERWTRDGGASAYVSRIGDDRVTRARLTAIIDESRQSEATRIASALDVWIDGTPLSAMQAGAFNFIAETIRSFVEERRSWRIHVTTDARGWDVLRGRLGAAAGRIRFHSPGRRSRPRRGFFRNGESIIEIIAWRGRYRFVRSHKIAVIHDLTTRIMPQLHPAATVAEFESYLAYVRHHAHVIATVSNHSRRDIVERLDVRPLSVQVVSPRVHTSYVNPDVDRSVPACHGLTAPYVLCVGTIEPRKNLRRLVKAFELLGQEELMRDVVLALAGPAGWDDSFDRDLIASEAYPRVRRLGFVPLRDMPSLYHCASAVVYPSVYEGFGLPVLEGLCSSAIVLTSGTTSLGEIAGDTVSTFNPFDASSIAGALLRALAMTPAEAAAYRVDCRTRGEALLRESVERPSFPTLASRGLGERRCASPSYSRSFI